MGLANIRHLIFPAAALAVAMAAHLTAVEAAAQTTAGGEARSARVDLLGTNLLPSALPGSEAEGQASSDDPDPTFDVQSTGALLSVPDVITVIGGPSETHGRAAEGTALTCRNPDVPDDETATVSLVSPVVCSEAGEATADVELVDVQAATSGAFANVGCEALGGWGHIDALTVMGDTYSIFDQLVGVGPNATILPGGADSPLPLLTVNRQVLQVDPVNGNASLLVQGFQLISQDALRGVLDVGLSEARSELVGAPLDCPIFGNPNFTGSTKLAEFSNDQDGDGFADEGDMILYTLRVVNSGGGDATDVQVFDRIPVNVTPDETSVTGADSFEFGPCPDDVTFTQCPPESASDQCLQATIDSLPAGETRDITFEVTVDATDRSEICNNFIVENHEPGPNIVPTDPGDGDGDGDGDGGAGQTGVLLATTGSGGCTVGPNGGGAGLLSFVSVLALLLGRRMFRLCR